MNDAITDFVRRGSLRPQTPNPPRIRSLLSAADVTAKQMIAFPLEQASATPIFRELYESLRLLGEALWLVRGFSVAAGEGAHRVALQSLNSPENPHPLSSAKLEWMRKIRNDANYDGYLVTPAQAKDLIHIWQTVAPETIAMIHKKLDQR